MLIQLFNDNRIFNIATFVVFILLFGCMEKKIVNQEKELYPPKAEIKIYQHKIHNDIRVDEFYWLNNPEDPEVIDYLEREKMTIMKNKILKKMILKKSFFLISYVLFFKDLI